MIVGNVEGGFLNGFSMGNGDYGFMDISHLLLVMTLSSLMEQILGISSL